MLVTAAAPAGGPQSSVPIAVEHLSVVLGTSRILHDVSLTVHSGEFVALLGTNGSGKSTLMRTLVGVLPPADGTARIFGADVTRRAAVDWERVGYVPQRSTATAGVPATVTEVVTAGLLSQRRLRLGRDTGKRATAALERVGMAHVARRSIGSLSGGQQQRVLIARALAREPELLLLDEPLAGVDSENQSAFATTMASLRDEGLTVLVVLHETGPLAPLLSRAVVLRHGRVVHDGAPPQAAPGHDAHDHDHQHEHADDGDDGRDPSALRVTGRLP